jgi:transcriptional regulator with XRE-family HTH domain
MLEDAKVIDRSTLYSEFGARLAAARKRLRWSQADLASKLSLSRTSVTNLECGRQPVQIHTLYQIADLLQISPSELLPPAKSSSKNVGNLKVETWLSQLGIEERLTNNDKPSPNPATVEQRK